MPAQTGCGQQKAKFGPAGQMVALILKHKTKNYVNSASSVVVATVW